MLFGSIGLERARHVFLTVGIIDFLMSSTACVVGQFFGETLQTMHLSASGIKGIKITDASMKLTPLNR